MSKQPELKIFDDKQIRTFWDSEQEKWFVSITDVIAVLTESNDPPNSKKKEMKPWQIVTLWKRLLPTAKYVWPMLLIPGKYSGLFNLFFPPNQSHSNFGRQK